MTGKSVSYFLQKFLNVVLVFLVLFALHFTLYPFINEQAINADKIIAGIFTFIFWGTAFFMIYELKRIISTIVSREPFCTRNISRFHNIAVCILILGVLDVLSNLHSTQGFILIRTPSFTIKPTIFIYIILGCLALILKEVFKMALEIKNDNDLTI